MKKPARMIGEIFRHIFKKPATSSYPFTPAKLMPDFRGRIDFDSAKCIGCKMCERSCPAKAIEIKLASEQPAAEEGKPPKKIYECFMHLDSCVFCWQCADSCPKKALIKTSDFELASVKKEELIRHYK